MDKKPKGLFIGFLLIVVGFLWLGSILDLFDINFIYALVNYWPIILIAIGFSIVFNKNVYAKLVVWVLAFVFLFVIAINGNDASINSTNTTLYQNESINFEEEVKEASLEIDFGAANIILNSNTNEAIKVDSSIEKLKVTKKIQNGKAGIYISDDTIKNISNIFNSNKDKRELNVSINPDLIWDIQLDAGAVKTDIDLSEAKISSIDISAGASEINVRLGDKLDKTNVSMSTGASNIVIIVPKESGVILDVDGAINSIDFNDIENIKSNGNYKTNNFNEADNLIYIDIDSGVSNIKIKSE